MTADQADSLLSACRRNCCGRERLAGYTTIKVGGPARLLYSVRDEREVALLLREAGQKDPRAGDGQRLQPAGV